MIELLKKQHEIIEEQKQVISDLLLLLDMGVAGTTKPLLTDTKKEKIRRWWDAGWTLSQIGKALNMDKSNVRSLIVKQKKAEKLCACGKKCGWSGRCPECQKSLRKSYCECGAEKARTSKRCMPCSADARVKPATPCVCGKPKSYRSAMCQQCSTAKMKREAKGHITHDSCPSCGKRKRTRSKHCMSCRKREGASKPMLVG